MLEALWFLTFYHIFIAELKTYGVGELIGHANACPGSSSMLVQAGICDPRVHYLLNLF